MKGRVAVMFDDMISTAGSIVGAAQVLSEHGAKEIHVCATHGLFCGGAVERLQTSTINHLVVTDTVPLAEDTKALNVLQLSVAPLLGEAIRRIHFNESVSYLFDSKLSDK